MRARKQLALLFCFMIFIASNAQAEWRGFEIGRNLPVAASLFSDFNDDGFLDLVAEINIPDEPTINVAVVLGNGDGTFQPRNEFTTHDPPARLNWVGGFAAHDIDSDGNQDLIITFKELDEVGIYLGNGDGTFQSPTYDATGEDPSSVKVTDVDGDSIDDIVIVGSTISQFPELPIARAYERSVFSVLLGNGDGTFKPVITSDAGTEPARTFIIHDFNNDDFPDVAIGYFHSRYPLAMRGIRVYLGEGDGTFTQSHYEELHPNFFIDELTGDNHIDILAVDLMTGQIILMVGNGDGTFQEPVSVTPVGFKKTGNSTVFADFNMDGAMDVAMGLGGLYSTNRVAIYPGNGNATFSPPLIYTTETGVGLLAADINSDGYVDLTNARKTLLNQGEVGTVLFPEGFATLNLTQGSSKSYLETEDFRTGTEARAVPNISTSANGIVTGSVKINIFDNSGLVTSGEIPVTGRTRLITSSYIRDSGSSASSIETTRIRQHIYLRGRANGGDGNVYAIHLNALSQFGNSASNEFGTDLRGNLIVYASGIHLGRERIAIEPFEFSYANVQMTEDSTTSHRGRRIIANTNFDSDTLGELPGGNTIMLARYNNHNHPRPGNYLLHSRNGRFRLIERGFLHATEQQAADNDHSIDYLLGESSLIAQFSSTPAATNMLRYTGEGRPGL